jgi:hypothetical protein
VLARLDAWLIGADDTRWVVVTGGPGMGKSAILATWLARHETSRATASAPSGQLAATPAPHHFISRQVAQWAQPEGIAASLAAQIEGGWRAVGHWPAPSVRRDGERPWQASRIDAMHAPMQRSNLAAAAQSRT